MHSISPAAFQSGQNVLLGDVFNSGSAVVLRVISEDNTNNFVLRLAQPALLQVVEYNLHLRLGAGDGACIGHGDR